MKETLNKLPIASAASPAIIIFNVALAISDEANWLSTGIDIIYLFLLALGCALGMWFLIMVTFFIANRLFRSKAKEKDE